MAEKDGLSLSLPDPPPPAPARREAGIAAAMERFDGGEAHAPERPRQRPAWRRPAVGAALTLSLLALFVAPMAWMVPKPEKPAVDHAILPSAPVERAQPEAEGPVDVGPHVRQEPAVPATPQAAPTPEPAQDIAEKPAASAPAQEAEPAPFVQADRAVMAPPPPPPPPPPPAPVAAAPMPQGAIAARSVNRARMAEKAEDARDIVVSAMRRDPSMLTGRGDWNACTVSDPQRSLSACKRYADPDGRGEKPQLADGLNRAWQGDWDGAIAAFDRGLAMAPRSSIAYLNRGLAHNMRGDEAQAMADLDKAIRYAPHSAKGYYQRSLLWRQRGDERRAKADRDRASELDPRYEP